MRIVLQGVYGGIVDGDDGYFLIALETNQRIHDFSFLALSTAWRPWARAEAMRSGGSSRIWTVVALGFSDFRYSSISVGEAGQEAVRITSAQSASISRGAM